MKLTSTAFNNGEEIPLRYSGDGDNISPPLSWSGPPEGTRSFVLICEDPDAPGKTWQHWGIYDIPSGQHSLPEHVPRTARADNPHQAQNDFHRIGYDGPLPPRGHGPHRYIFRLFAVSVDRLPLRGLPSCEAVAEASAKLALAVAELTGSYER
jgi:Raf kinase inhibitor-like YbhB/YbcL family protein